MSNKGKLYLIPNVIAGDAIDKIVTPQMAVILPHISDFIVENIRTARRYLSSLKLYPSVEHLRFSVMDKDTRAEDIPVLMEPVFRGADVGVISEAGCPGIADPGSQAVLFSHQHDIRVVPLVGPSSIFLALMASGLNGQNFAFHGYLPVEKQNASKAIKDFEKQSRQADQTQIFIETPYRNNAVFETLMKSLNRETLLTVAVDITGSTESIRTRQVKGWINERVVLPKTPAVFLFLARR
jgi:16S rRNA (cytidine1402-2'-O)-methyltransferase